MFRSVKHAVALGRIHADPVRFDEAIDAVIALRARGAGGTVVTPNVDHVVLAEKDEEFRRAYQSASLALADGKPLVWLSRALGAPLPEKVSGSDLVEPLCARAAQDGSRVFFLGAAPGVAARAADRLKTRLPRLQVAGVLSPPLHFERDAVQNAAVLDAVRAAAPDLVFVALGAPRQEIWMARHRVTLAPAVLLGIGGTLDPPTTDYQLPTTNYFLFFSSMLISSWISSLAMLSVSAALLNLRP
jgi:N-acetylglucosaminyldiphosphoundecaprenol N-acetyl-beta-D-mannosaminyltransferase